MSHMTVLMGVRMPTVTCLLVFTPSWKLWLPVHPGLANNIPSHCSQGCLSGVIDTTVEYMPCVEYKLLTQKPAQFIPGLHLRAATKEGWVYLEHLEQLDLGKQTIAITLPRSHCPECQRKMWFFVIFCIICTVFLVVVCFNLEHFVLK